MNDLFEISLSPVNAFFTIMSVLLLLYWLAVIFLGFDPDLFSIDFDADIDAEIQFDKHYDVPQKQVESHEPSGFLKILKFFNFDELPLMFMLTILFFSMWFISVNVTYYLGIENIGLGLLFLIPNFIVSLFLIKFLSKPFAFIYKQINHKGEKEIDFLGRRCTVLTTLDQNKIGQVELLVSGDPMKIYAKSNTEEKLSAGQEAVIVDESNDRKYYLVEKFEY